MRYEISGQTLAVSSRAAAARAMKYIQLPLKPSLEMLTAGARAGDVTPETVWEIYRAMIKESQRHDPDRPADASAVGLPDETAVGEPAPPSLSGSVQPFRKATSGCG